MSKKKNNNQTSKLSPENYIRQQSRNLPIYKCIVNNNWENNGMATIFIARKHVSGNITFCVYMVDLYCLGVKDSFYKYNMPGDSLQKVYDSVADTDMPLIEISYELAHNIIYAAIEFADEYGFSPAIEFTRVTQYFLEEDDDKIPLIDIHCGNEDGKPMYINNDDDNPARKKFILAQLEKNAGPGNFEYILHPEDDFNEEDFDDEDFDEDDFDDEDDDFDDEDDDFDDDEENFDKYRDDETEELKKTFRSLEEDELKDRYLEMLYAVKTKDKNITKDPSKEIMAMADVILEQNVDTDKIIHYINKFKINFDCDIIDILDLPNSLFAGLQTDDYDKVRETYSEINDMLTNGKTQMALKKIRKEFGEIPYLHYCELTSMKLKDNVSKEKYDKKLDECYRKYPDYFLFKTLHYANLGKNEELKTLMLERKEPITVEEIAEFWYQYTKSALGNDCVPEKFTALSVLLALFHVKTKINIHIISLLLLMTEHDIVKKLCGYDEWIKKKK